MYKTLIMKTGNFLEQKLCRDETAGQNCEPSCVNIWNKKLLQVFYMYTENKSGSTPNFLFYSTVLRQWEVRCITPANTTPPTQTGSTALHSHTRHITQHATQH